MFDPHTYAEEHGITIIERPLQSNGLWIPEHRTILMHRGLRPAMHRSVLAHELGHAMLGHTTDSPRNERQADLWAARQLIDVVQLHQLSLIYAVPEAFAHELGVTSRILKTYLEATPLQLTA